MRNWFLVLVFFVLTGCAVAEKAPEGAADQGTLKKRAEARWQALVAGDVGATYEFLSPGSKAVYTKDLYLKVVRPRGLLAAKFHSAKCAVPDSCQVLMEVESMFRPEFGRVTSIKEEQWLKDGGTWWVVFKE